MVMRHGKTTRSIFQTSLRSNSLASVVAVTEDVEDDGKYNCGSVSGRSISAAAAGLGTGAFSGSCMISGRLSSWILPKVKRGSFFTYRIIEGIIGISAKKRKAFGNNCHKNELTSNLGPYLWNGRMQLHGQGFPRVNGMIDSTRPKDSNVCTLNFIPTITPGLPSCPSIRQITRPHSAPH